MAVRPTDPEALHLFQLIGAPLLAVIQAEVQAAQVSADFIKRVGFEQLPPAPPAQPPSQSQPQPQSPQPEPAAATAPEDRPLQDGGGFGDLRVAEFRIDRFAADGKPTPFLVRVPVLSLFPIPLLQVKHADFDFDIHVVTRVPVEDPRGGREDSALNKPMSPDYLSENRVELKGFLAGGRRGGAAGTADASIKVKVRMEQSDLPVGLTNLMRIMDESVSVAPLALVEQGRAAAAGQGEREP